ncbi:hypothetical protein RF11_04618 [Thelohanellus kitauei]|uniref:ISXO2-like transposase domain-containing protein n=1 Tax=Thelohanellus kitauei TaxID=669202 RepID=A0A0C2JQC6_THEKT|nr:hypothetical protein RF11_04618 [Thelohanellus kitauei]
MECVAHYEESIIISLTQGELSTNQRVAVFIRCKHEDDKKISHHKTVVDCKSFIRDIFINHVLNHSSHFGGPGIVVQVDESLLCKGNYGVERILSNRDLVIVGGIDETGSVFMELTVIRNMHTLKETIRRNIALENEYVLEVVIHDHEFVNAEGYHTQRIEDMWAACKRLFRLKYK